MATKQRPGYLRVINGGLSDSPGKVKKCKFKTPETPAAPLDPELVSLISRVKFIFEKGSREQCDILWGRLERMNMNIKERLHIEQQW